MREGNAYGVPSCGPFRTPGNDLDHLEGEFVYCKRWLPRSRRSQIERRDIWFLIVYSPDWGLSDEQSFVVDLGPGRRSRFQPLTNSNV